MPTRPCWVEIHTRALEENFRFLASIAAPQVLGVPVPSHLGTGDASNLMRASSEQVAPPQVAAPQVLGVPAPSHLGTGDASNLMRASSEQLAPPQVAAPQVAAPQVLGVPVPSHLGTGDTSSLMRASSEQLAPPQVAAPQVLGVPAPSHLGTGDTSNLMRASSEQLAPPQVAAPQVLGVPAPSHLGTGDTSNLMRASSEQVAPPQVAELLAIVKADAYGHSLALCAPAAVRGGARWLGVTSVEEGVAARALCPEVHILVLGGVFPGQGAALVASGLTAVVWEPAQLDELEGAARAAGRAGSLPVHLEIDTGMSRQGVVPEALSPLLARFYPGSPLRLEGVMTHLFAADEADGRVTAEQMTRLSEALQRVEEAGIYPEWLNVGNSAALLAGEAGAMTALAARHGMQTLLRPGLALYGLAPQFDPRFEQDEPEPLSAARRRLRPVLEWKTRVTSLRRIAAGAVVGYNGTFVATEPMRLALVAVGYADGLDRRLGNRFSLLVRGARAPLVGRVSMDQAVVDVTGIPAVEAGDEVVILGTQGGETITAYDHAEASGTIPWEIFTRIGARVPKVTA